MAAARSDCGSLPAGCTTRERHRTGSATASMRRASLDAGRSASAGPRQDSSQAPGTQPLDCRRECKPLPAASARSAERVCYTKFMPPRPNDSCLSWSLLIGRHACLLSWSLLAGLSLIACGPSAVVDPHGTRASPSPDSTARRPAPAYAPSDSTDLRPAPTSPPSDPTGLHSAPAYPAASEARVAQPRGGLEEPPPPRPVAPPPRPPALPPGQTTRLGIGPPPPEVIHPHPAGGAADSSRESPVPPAATAPAARRQISAR